MGPFKRLLPNTYRLEIPATWRACDKFNVERLRSHHSRPDCLGPLGGAPGPPPPVPGADGWLEYEVQQLLKFKMRWGLPYVLVRWVGCDASGVDARHMGAALQPH